MVTTSTCEAEYVAIALAAKEAVWERSLLQELGVLITTPTVINSDSQSAIHVTRNGIINPRTKAINIKHHFLKDLSTNNIISICYKPTGDQIADALTKPLPRGSLERFRVEMGVGPPTKGGTVGVVGGQHCTEQDEDNGRAETDETLGTVKEEANGRTKSKETHNGIEDAQRTSREAPVATET